MPAPDVISCEFLVHVKGVSTLASVKGEHSRTRRSPIFPSPTTEIMVFTSSPAELALVAKIFAKADPRNTGVVTADAAIKIIGGSNLSVEVLGNIWDIADKDNNGRLSRKGVAVAVRLIGWAQQGKLNVTEASANRRECTTSNGAVRNHSLKFSYHKRGLFLSPCPCCQ